MVRLSKHVRFMNDVLPASLIIFIIIASVSGVNVTQSQAEATTKGNEEEPGTGTGTPSTLLSRLQNNAAYLAFTIVIVLLGLGGNFMAFMSIIYWLPRNVTNICLASQAIADFITVAFSPTVRITNSLNGQWTTGNIGCHLVYGIRDFSFITSALTLTLLGVERFIAICYPLGARLLISNRKTVNSLVVIWIFGVGMGIWRSFNVEYRSSPAQCVRVSTSNSTVTAYFTTRWVAIFLLPLVAQAYCYGRSTGVLYKSLMQIRQLKRAILRDAEGTSRGQSASDDNTKLKIADADKKGSEIRGRMKVNGLLMTIIGLFLVFWGPIITYEAYQGFVNVLGVARVTSTTITLVNVFYLLSYANSAVNPVLYGIFLSPVRACYQRILCCHKCRGTVFILPGDMTGTVTQKKARPSVANITQGRQQATSSTAGRQLVDTNESPNQAGQLSPRNSEGNVDMLIASSSRRSSNGFLYATTNL